LFRLDRRRRDRQTSNFRIIHRLMAHGDSTLSMGYFRHASWRYHHLPRHVARAGAVSCNASVPNPKFASFCGAFRSELSIMSCLGGATT
jgi:hypothetical protein